MKVDKCAVVHFYRVSRLTVGIIDIGMSMCMERVYVCVLWALLTSLLVNFEKGGDGAATSAFRQVDKRVQPREDALGQK